MKKLIALICVMASILMMTACQNSETAQLPEDVDQAMVQQIVEGLYAQFSAMTAENIENMINARNSEIADDANTALVIRRGLTSWRDTQSDLGAVVSKDNFEVTVDDETITGTMYLTYEQRTAKFIVMFDRDLTCYEGIRVEADYSFGEKMSNAALNTVMGMGTVFVVLILIAFLISCFKYVNRLEHYLAHRKDKKEPETVFVPKSSAGAPVVIDVEPQQEVDDLALVAVITAAVAASMNTSVDNLIVRSIRKSKNNRQARGL